MADNTTINAMSGGDVIATDDISGVKYQRVKLVDGTADSTTAIPGDGQGLYSQGSVSHDGADAARPVKAGLKAISFGANPTAVASADVTDWYATRAGQAWMLGGHPNIVTLEAEYTSAQTNAAIITVSSGTIIVVTSCNVTLDEATTVGVGFRIGFAAATTPTTTGVVHSHPGMVPGGGAFTGNGGSVLGVGADGEDLRITSEVPTTGALRVVVSYFTIAG